MVVLEKILEDENGILLILLDGNSTIKKRDWEIPHLINAYSQISGSYSLSRLSDYLQISSKLEKYKKEKSENAN